MASFGPVIAKAMAKGIEAKKMKCILLSKRDRQSLFQRSKSLQTPQASPPTFLFLLIFNCQITDRIKQSQNQSPQSHKPRNPTSNPLINLISSERKSPSPAAPPPSFSERAYKSTQPNKSTQQYQKKSEM
ncbi:hypothetical protein [Agrobacterium tumefaciens]|uniref:hypothetical protein n=3 Tax=Agrobacterium tumefaciens TaxID=358 RepID=UPI001319D8BF|nr:hypothetical protein [Agrobacterium tumefaciens]